MENFYNLTIFLTYFSIFEIFGHLVIIFIIINYYFKANNDITPGNFDQPLNNLGNSFNPSGSSDDDEAEKEKRRKTKKRNKIIIFLGITIFLIVVVYSICNIDITNEPPAHPNVPQNDPFNLRAIIAPPDRADAPIVYPAERPFVESRAEFTVKHAPVAGSNAFAPKADDHLF